MSADPSLQSRRPPPGSCRRPRPKATIAAAPAPHPRPVSPIALARTHCSPYAMVSPRPSRCLSRISSPKASNHRPSREAIPSISESNSMKIGISRCMWMYHDTPRRSEGKGRRLHMIKWRRALAAVALAMAVAPPAAAQQQAEWPKHPIRFIVPFPAGGSTDVAARVIANSLTRVLGQQVVVENKSGASGNVGFEAAARSAPDGYSVLIASDQVASAPHVFKVSFDPLKD